MEADANVVVDILAQEIARLVRENAFLQAALAAAVGTDLPQDDDPGAG